MSGGEAPPEQTNIQLRLAWPPVEISEEPETRREHARMGLLMGLATVSFLITGVYWFAPLTAFIAGYAYCNWLVFPDLYDQGGETA